MSRVFKEYLNFLILGLLVLWGGFLRYNGLNKNISFWSDEATTSIYSRAIFLRGSPTLLSGNLEDRGVWYYYLTAISFRLLGLSEFAARMPSVLFGVGCIILTFILSKQLFDEKIAIGATSLLTFSVFEIVWSRQARWYSATQFFYLSFLVILWNYIHSFTRQKKQVAPIIVLFLTLLVFLKISPIAIPLLLSSFLAVNLSFLKDLLRLDFKMKIRYLILTLMIIILLFWVLFTSKTNQVTYYGLQFLRLFNHSRYYFYFLWHEYSIVSLLSLMGLFSLRWKKTFWLLAISLFGYLFYLSFLTAYQYTRYLFPIFPLFLILTAEGLRQISSLIFKNKPLILYFGLLVIILLSGFKFRIWAQPYYSLNSDFRETPEADYKKGYQKVKTIENLCPDLVIVDSHPELGVWYLGEQEKIYSLKDKSVVDWYARQGWKIDPYSGGNFVSNTLELKTLMSEKKCGAIVLEYTEAGFLSRDLVSFIEKNTKEEILISSLSFPSRFAGWPLKVYSWGIK